MHWLITVALCWYYKVTQIYYYYQLVFGRFHSTETLIACPLTNVVGPLIKCRQHCWLFLMFAPHRSFTIDRSILLQCLETGLLWRLETPIQLDPLLPFRPLTGWYLWAFVFSLVPYTLRSPSRISVLTSLLYTVADLGRILSEQGVTSSQYADDTQSYVYDLASAVAILVDLTMSSNRLGLNSDRTQFIWLCDSPNHSSLVLWDCFCHMSVSLSE